MRKRRVHRDAEQRGIDDGNSCTLGDVCTNGVCSGLDRPGEVLQVRWTPGSKDELVWNAIPGATAYPVYRGLPDDLINLLGPAVDSCFKLTALSTSTGHTITETPGSGKFFWYLVRAYDGQCTGTPGNGTAGRRQHNPSGFCP